MNDMDYVVNYVDRVQKEKRALELLNAELAATKKELRDAKELLSVIAIGIAIQVLWIATSALAQWLGA